MIVDLEQRRQLARDRERLSYLIAKEWRAVGRWDFSGVGVIGQQANGRDGSS